VFIRGLCTSQHYSWHSLWKESALLYQLCHYSSKRLEDNWHSGRLPFTKHRLLERRSPECRRVMCRGRVPYGTSYATVPLSGQRTTGIVVFCPIQNTGSWRGIHPNAVEVCKGEVPYCTSYSTVPLSGQRTTGTMLFCPIYPGEALTRMPQSYV